MSQLVLDLIKNITTVSKADGAEFSALIKDSFEACSTFESYLTGIAEKQYVHCISQCLQQTAETATSPELRPYLWNPIVASLVKCISTLSDRTPRGSYTNPKPPGVQSSSTRKTASDRTPVHPTSNKKNSGKAQTQAIKVNAGKLSSAVAKVSLEPTSGVPTPSISSGAEVGPQLRLKVYSEIRVAREQQKSCFFKQLKGGNHGEPVTCKVPGCTVCEKYFSQLPITKCSDIRCHRSGKCTDSGWYPHVLPHIWAVIKRAHSQPETEVKFTGLPTNVIMPLVTPSTLVSPPLPKKRSWAQAVVDDSMHSDSDEPSTPKIMSPVWSGESWSAQVEREERTLEGKE